MKKLLPFLFALLIIQVNVQAQNVFMEHDTAFISGTNFDILASENYLVNNTTTSYNLKWTREEINLPAGWTTVVCDKNNCYSTSTSTKDFYLNANETNALLKVNFMPNGFNGSGLVKISVTANDGSGINLDSYYISQALSTGVTSTHEVKDIFTYPTPVRDNMNVVFNPNLKPTRIDVFNLLGQKVKTFPVELERNISRAELQLSDLDKGMYFIRVYQTGTNEVITKQFTKE